MVAGAGGGYVEEVTFGFVDLHEVGFVGYGFDPLLRRDDLVVAGHHHDDFELEAFGYVHGADDHFIGWVTIGVELAPPHGRGFHGAAGAGEFIRGADEDADLVGVDAIGLEALEPRCDGGGFVGFAGFDFYGGVWAVEDGDGAAAILGVAVDVGDDGWEEAVGLTTDLVGGSVVDAEDVGAAADVNAERFPGKGGLEDALAEVAGEEEAVGLDAGEGGEEAELGDADVLGFVDDGEIVGFRSKGISESTRGDEYIPRSRTRDRQECLPHRRSGCLPHRRCRLGSLHHNEGVGYAGEDGGHGGEAGGGELVTDAAEDLPEELAPFFGKAGLAAEAGHVAVLFPGLELPGVDDVVPFGPEEAVGE